MNKPDPQEERTRLEQLYAGMADEELDQLLDSADELTDLARDALKAEVEKRGGHVEYELEPGQGEDEHPALITIAEFRDMQEAMLACGLLKSAGIEFFLADENTVRMNWFWSNMIGNMRLMVREQDVEAAQEILKQPPDMAEAEPPFEKQKCPNCGSLDIEFRGMDQGLGMSKGWDGSRSSAARDLWTCNECGAQWRGAPDQPKFDA